MVIAVVAVLSLGTILLALSGHTVGAGLAALILMYSRVAETSSARGGMLAVAEISVLGLALIIAGIRILGGGNRSMTGTLGFWSAAILYLAVLYASSIWASDAGAAVAQADAMAKDLVVVYLLAELFSTLPSQRLATWTIIGVAACLATLTIIQAVTHTYTNSYFGLAQASVHQIVGNSHGYRSAGPIGDPNFYGLALAVIVPSALFRIRDEQTHLLRALAAAATVLLLFGIVLTYSRTATIALAVALVAFVFMSSISLRHIAIAALCLVPVLIFIPSQFWHRAASITSDDQSIQGRTASDQVAFDIFLQHPVLGVGADNYQFVYTTYAADTHLLNAAPEAHDLYLATAAETGLLGLATLGSALGIVLLRSWRARREALRIGNRPWEGLAGGYFLALIAYLTGSLFVPNAYPRYLWILVGLAIATSRRPPTGLGAQNAAFRISAMDGIEPAMAGNSLGYSATSGSGAPLSALTVDQRSEQTLAVADSPVNVEPARSDSTLIPDLQPVIPGPNGEVTRGGTTMRRLIKRTIDVVLTLPLIIVALPVLMIVAAVLLATDPGPVIFRQTRIGRGGKTFKIWKFRTMTVQAEEELLSQPALYERYVNSHHKLASSVDHRINRVGRTLRLTSLDELPQLFNVLGGSMSLVGPRPVTSPELVHYGQDLGTVLSVRPGMTGLWQVSGRSLIGYPERARLDLTYASTYTIAMDLRILAQTLGSVIRREGAI